MAHCFWHRLLLGKTSYKYEDINQCGYNKADAIQQPSKQRPCMHSICSRSSYQHSAFCFFFSNRGTLWNSTCKVQVSPYTIFKRLESSYRSIKRYKNRYKIKNKQINKSGRYVRFPRKIDSSRNQKFVRLIVFLKSFHFNAIADGSFRVYNIAFQQWRTSQTQINIALQNCTQLLVTNLITCT